MEISLDSDQIKLLLNHKGYGIEENYAVNTLFIGNESGIGDALNVEEYIKHLRGEECIKKPIVKDLAIRSPFIQFISRITRSLEGKNGKWFAPKNSCDVWDKIVQGPFFSVSAYLIDIRPLPRPNESGWHYINIDRKNYEKGFRTFQSKDPIIQNLIDGRLTSLRNQISAFRNLKYIIAPGDANMKVRFLQSLFPEIAFEPIMVSTSKKTMTYYRAVLKKQEDSIIIFVTPFFDSKNGIGYEGLEALYNLIKESAIQ